LNEEELQQLWKESVNSTYMWE